MMSHLIYFICKTTDTKSVCEIFCETLHWPIIVIINKQKHKTRAFYFIIETDERDGTTFLNELRCKLFTFNFTFYFAGDRVLIVAVIKWMKALVITKQLFCSLTKNSANIIEHTKYI